MVSYIHNIQCQQLQPWRKILDAKYVFLININVQQSQNKNTSLSKHFRIS